MLMSALRPPRAQRGLTLIELMVGLVVGFIVAAAAFGMYMTSLRTSTEAAKASRLHHELQAVMDLMVADIRRAGAWNALATPAVTANPFTRGGQDTPPGTTDLLTNNTAVTAGNCVKYAYDLNGDGLVGTAPHERFGFSVQTFAGSTVPVLARLTAPPVNGSGVVIWDAASCPSGNWESLTDSSVVRIDAFEVRTQSFQGSTGSQCKPQGGAAAGCTGYNAATRLVSASGNFVETREVNLLLRGRLVEDPTVVKTLRATVKVRNDRFFTAS